MRSRAVVAAVAGSAAAATGHLLDATGRLPLVHEDAAVRLGMRPLVVLCWLTAAALLGAVAAVTRPLLVGAPVAVAVSAAPEVWGRGDVGAVTEPGALLGALLQLLLLLLVAAVAVVLDRLPSSLHAGPAYGTRIRCGPRRHDRVPARRFAGDVRPRAPPRREALDDLCSRRREETHVPRTQGPVVRARARAGPDRRRRCVQ